MFEEAKRRDQIVRNLAAKLNYGPGDTVTPSTKEAAEQYGEDIRVVKICDTYGKFGKDERWPDSDNPMIVHAWSDKLNQSLVCTVGFLVKK